MSDRVPHCLTVSCEISFCAARDASRILGHDKSVLMLILSIMRKRFTPFAPSPLNTPMTDRFRIALAQLNPMMGDIAGNLRAGAARARGSAKTRDLILFSELFIVGYPPEDLVLKPALQQDAREAIEKFAQDTADGGPAVLIGAPWVEDGKLYNAVSAARRRQDRRPAPSSSICRITACSTRSACSSRARCRGRSTFAACASAFPSAKTSGRPTSSNVSPKPAARFCSCRTVRPSKRARKMCASISIAARVTEAGLPLIYLNQVGGQDELVFDGASLVVNADRSIAWALPAWEERVVVTEWERKNGRWVCAPGETMAGRGPQRVRLSRDDAGPARLCEQEPLSGRGVGIVGRYQLRAIGRRRCRCARAGTRALRDDAVALYVARKASTTRPNAPRCWACRTRS